MPWQPEDADRHTKKATTARLKRMWSVVANTELAKTGDDAIAIRSANAAVRDAGKTNTKKPKGK